MLLDEIKGKKKIKKITERADLLTYTEALKMYPKNGKKP